MLSTKGINKLMSKQFNVWRNNMASNTKSYKNGKTNWKSPTKLGEIETKSKFEKRRGVRNEIGGNRTKSKSEKRRGIRNEIGGNRPKSKFEKRRGIRNEIGGNRNEIKIRKEEKNLTVENAMSRRSV